MARDKDAPTIEPRCLTLQQAQVIRRSERSLLGGIAIARGL